MNHRPQTVNKEPVMPHEDMTVDRAAVKRMVEEFWRLLVLQGRNWGQAHPTMSQAELEARYFGQARDMSQQFTARMDATAALMSPEQAKVFLQMVDEEDTICSEERQQNPDAFYRRLGLELTSTPCARPPIAHRRQGIGEMAARTAVRATIWELIFSLFRR